MEMRFAGTMACKSFMRFKIEPDRETDGRWIAEVLDLPGVMAHAKIRSETVAKIQAQALRVLANRQDL